MRLLLLSCVLAWSTSFAEDASLADAVEKRDGKAIARLIGQVDVDAGGITIQKASALIDDARC